MRTFRWHAKYWLKLMDIHADSEDVRSSSHEGIVRAESLGAAVPLVYDECARHERKCDDYMGAMYELIIAEVQTEDRYGMFTNPYPPRLRRTDGRSSAHHRHNP